MLSTRPFRRVTKQCRISFRTVMSQPMTIRMTVPMTMFQIPIVDSRPRLTLVVRMVMDISCPAPSPSQTTCEYYESYIHPSLTVITVLLHAGSETMFCE